ncbi:M20/M25/M40 family metallo-hydrolase [Chenggangzhangella methanolivorans]|nr:M20/M25/M40 family metallo-hydrolase [Chenggangzhangella methanolivorans]
MGLRRDALLAASHLIVEARAIADRWPGKVHSSVGRLVVAPNSANVVPCETRLSLEIRSNDDGVLAEASALADAAIATAAERAAVEVASVVRNERAIRPMPAAVSDLVEASAAALGAPSLRLDTVAGHDAISLLGHCPTGLVFVPSAGGIAHNEAEFTAPKDVETGFSVCLEAAARLCRAAGSPERALDQQGLAA